MGANWTPGPWRVDTDGKGATSEPCNISVVWCGENSYAGRGGSYSIGYDEARANARLCAAAPALYEALRELLDACAGYERDAERSADLEMTDACKQARTAIARAEGRS